MLILGTSIAAFVHSTWSIGVMFGGEPPHWDAGNWASWVRWAYWLIPAALVAFSLDIGQVAVSREIRNGNRSFGMYGTLLILAVAGYYMQFFYMIHHMPALELGAGVYTTGFAGATVLFLRNAVVWIGPAFLPALNTMYTLGSKPSDHVAEQKTTVIEESPVIIPDRAVLLQSNLSDQAPEQPVITANLQPVSAILSTPVQELLQSEPVFTATCPACGWTKTGYHSDLNAQRALNAHARVCSIAHPELQVIPIIPVHTHSSNGNGANHHD
jgi:hypothetical protein